MSNADPIAEARGWDAPGVAQHAVSALDTIRRLAAALKAQPAPLVADSREAVIDALRQEGHAPMNDHSPVDGSCTSCPWPVFMLPPGDIADHLLASGVVSLAADRDRAVAERCALIAVDAASEARVRRDDSDYPESHYGNRLHGELCGATDVAVRIRRAYRESEGK